MKVHLSGICGTAMASLAGLLRERGHEVTGSDQDVYPPMSTQLAALGIPIRSPYAEANVPPEADLVVIGNALSRGNPEVEAVLDRRQRLTSLPALLAEEFLRPRQSLVVAGTHGKTTTTSLLAFILEQAGLDPSFLVGGVPLDFGRSYRLGSGAHFVIEGDEYDCAFFDKRPKFVHYLPNVAVIGNVEYDHADIYPDLASVQTAFVRLMNVIPRRGLLVAGIESPALGAILPKAPCRVETFAVGVDADWRADDVRPEAGGARFRLRRRGQDAGELALALPGEHNVRNALAALAVAAEAGVPPEASRAALAAFRGVKRRLEVRGRVAGVTIYDDFAHHPTAVRATLRALRDDGTAPRSGRLIAVFEPRSYTSRTRVFQEDFAHAFEGADQVLVAAAHLPGKVPEAQRLSEAELVEAITRGGTEATFVPTVDAIVARLAAELRAGDRVVVLSNGGFGGIHEKLLATLAKAPGVWYENAHLVLRMPQSPRDAGPRPERVGESGLFQGGRYMKRSLLAVFGLGVFAAGAAMAQDASQAATPKKEDDVVKREEVVVVTASKVETTLINSPATISVITPDVLDTTSATNYGDLLRNVPGLNVIQTSARDINMTSRQSTNTLTNSTLVLLDGRSLYLDFFGLVLWDFVPQNASEIKQIEVVRGPASAVWGANAMTGVVNIITKTPRDAEGFGLNLTGGLFNRSVGSFADEGSGYTYGSNFSFAKAPSEKLSYRLSAGYFNSDPLSRPVGTVPLSTHPLDSSIKTGGGNYSIAGFENDGTSQPKVDLRVDQELSNGGRITYQGGYAGTTGIIHTGIGPFDIVSPSYLAYGKINFSKNALKVNVFGNFTDAKAPSLLNVDPATLEAVQLNFKTQTYDFEVGNSNVIAGKHILSYGGNYRRNNFDITLTPNSENRNEFGAYFQEEFFTEKFRLAAGVRADKFGNLDNAVFSPRLSLMVKPTRDHSIRLSFNRAFRAPSVVNNYLDQDIFAATLIDLRPLGPLLPPPLKPFVALPVRLQVNTFGNKTLKEESINAYEVAYTGTVGGKTTLGLALYRNDQDDNINFTNLSTLAATDPATAFANGLTFYSVTDPAKVIQVNPDGSLGQYFTFPPALMGVLAVVPGVPRLPKNVSTYLNLGPIRYEGVEASIEHSFSKEVSAFANYSYQRTPKVLEQDSDQIRYPTEEVGVPAKNRFNAGVNFNTKKFLGSASLNYSDKAFWVDVLDPPLFGYTDSYAMVNASFGMKFNDGKVTATLKGTNLTNETIQQHIFGDILKISVAAEVRIFVK